MLRNLRWLILIILAVVPVRGMRAETVASLPEPSGYVSDFAGVLTPETKQALEDLCTQVDHNAHAQIAVVTVKSMDADKSGAVPSIEEFATALEDKWKVGKKGTDRGVLLIFSLSPRKYRIEVGYGLEGLLNDAKVGDIGREMAPFLHTDDYNQGISLGVHDLAHDIAADAGVALTGDATGLPEVHTYRREQPQLQLSLFQVLLFGGVVVVVLGVLIRTGHIGMLFFILFNILGGGGGGRGGGGFGGGGGGEGGGFGGFGGGSSGGGGASGDF